MKVAELGRFGSIEVTCLTVGPWRANCYLVKDSAKGWLIDPGDEFDALHDYLSQTRTLLTRILLTHGHFDHIGAAQALARRFALTCEMHPADTKLIKVANAYAVKFGQARFEIPQAPLPLVEGDELQLSDEVFNVHHLPGHTEGGIALISSQLAFSGDTLLAEKIGRTDLPGGSSTTISHSVERLVGALSDQCLICPGHGRPWQAADAKAWWRTHSDDRT